jgi:hypothetical protein
MDRWGRVLEVSGFWELVWGFVMKRGGECRGGRWVIGNWVF